MPFDDRVDGIEYRIYSEISKHWNTSVNLRTPNSKENGDPYKAVLRDVKDGKSDLALCSIWMNHEHYRDFDLTSFIDRQCVTFLVPVNKLVRDGSTIYNSLSGAVWVLYIGAFISTGIILFFMARVYFRKINVGQGTQAFDFFSRNYMDLVNIASSHGIQRLPKPIPLKIVVMRYSIAFAIYVRKGIYIIESFIILVGCWSVWLCALAIQRDSHPYLRVRH